MEKYGKLSLLPLLIWNTTLMVRDAIEHILLVCSTSRRYNEYLQISSLRIFSLWYKILCFLFMRIVRLNVCCYRLQLCKRTQNYTNTRLPSTHFYRNLLRCMSTSPCVSTILSKGDNIYDFLFTPLNDKILLK